MAIYLAIDLGTTGCRSILFDEKLALISSAYEEYGLITPKENWTEQDAELWWQMTLRTSKEAVAKAGVDSAQIDGISVSSQGITIAPVDDDIKPLCNALSWLDMRAEEQTERIRKDYGETAIFTLTGKPVNAAYTLPKLLWIKENLPDTYSKAYKFLMPMDFLIAKFTGNCVTDHSMASGTLFYDIKNCCWSKEILEHYNLPESKLPELKWSGESAGTVLPEVAKELGLRSDCVVAVGAQDQKCAAVGAGLDKRSMTISLGTAGAITKLWTECKTEEYTQVGWCGYVEPGTWVTEGVVNTAGTCLRWVRDLMFKDEDYSVIDNEAMQALERGSSLMFYPYLGEEACFYGANLATTRGDFAAAVMEGIAFQIKSLLEKMEADKGIERIILFGGGAKGDLWCQIISDVTGKEILVPVTAEAAGAGAAMLAAKACGKVPDALSMAKTYCPKREYDEKYCKYRTIEKKIWNGKK